MKEELWKVIEGLPPYQISNLGRVKSPKHPDGYYVKPDYKWGKGYCRRTFITPTGKQVNKRVHQLVAIHFLENPNNLPEVNHLDGNKLNNAASNLEWSSCKDNIRHATKLGLRSDFKRENALKAKLTEKDVKHIREVYQQGGVTQTSLGKLFKVTSRTIGHIVNNETWV